MRRRRFRLLMVMLAVVGAQMDKAALQRSHAGFISRSIAFVIDILLMAGAVLATVALVQALLGFFTLYGLVGQNVTQSSVFRDIVLAVVALISAIIAIGYPVGCWTLLGQTLGKFLMGVRVTRVDGKPLTLRDALVRYVGYWLSLLPLGLGFLWVLVDAQRQGWHDKLAGTCVVYDTRSPFARTMQRARTPA